MSAVEELARWCDENQEIILSALTKEGDRVKRGSLQLALYNGPAARAWAEDAASIEKARADFHDLMDRWFVESDPTAGVVLFGPEVDPCAACGAVSGEPCRPGCIGSLT